MNYLRVTTTERESGALSTQHLHYAVRCVLDDGFVVVTNAVSKSSIDALNNRMLEDLPKIVGRSDAPYNWNISNVQHDPPPFSPYLFRDILFNEFAIAITSQILGPGVKNGYYSGNTALKSGGSRQPVHADIGQLWSDLPVATPPFALVVNIPLVDIAAENGSTELWPGTHLDTSVSVPGGDLKVPPERLEITRSFSPPFQPDIPVGSFIIRDIRMWHAGMPNHTDIPRVMLAMIHQVSWWNEIDAPQFLNADRAFFNHPNLRTAAQFVDGPIDYINRSMSYDYKPEKSI